MIDWEKKVIKVYEYSPEESRRIFLEAVRCAAITKEVTKEELKNCKVRAVKLLRNETNLGLAEAKYLMDFMVEIDEAIKGGKFIGMVKGKDTWR